MKSRLLGAVCACLAALTFNVNAATIVDNGTYTTVDGVDWLDLAATAGMSYSQVSAQLGSGGAFEGWTYATVAQVEGLWTAFGGDPAYYTGFSTQNNGLFDRIAPLFGDLFCQQNGCQAGDGYSYWTTLDNPSRSARYAAYSYDRSDDERSIDNDLFLGTGRFVSDSFGDALYGSALYRAAVVPIPAAGWLFSVGLLGLFGVARRKVRV